MAKIKLQSSEGLTFEIDVEVIKCSNTLSNMLEICGTDDEEKPVALPNIKSSTLLKVIEWATHHKDDPPPPESDDDDEKRTDDIPLWDVNFLDVDQNALFDIMLAADYLDIKVLLTLCCKTVANLIKGKTPEQIRMTFNIKNDLLD